MRSGADAARTPRPRPRLQRSRKLRRRSLGRRLRAGPRARARRALPRRQRTEHARNAHGGGDPGRSRRSSVAPVRTAREIARARPQRGLFGRDSFPRGAFWARSGRGSFETWWFRGDRRQVFGLWARPGGRLLATASQPRKLAGQCFGVAFVPNTAAGQLRSLTGFPRGPPPGASDEDGATRSILCRPTATPWAGSVSAAADQRVSSRSPLSGRSAVGARDVCTRDQ